MIGASLGGCVSDAEGSFHSTVSGSVASPAASLEANAGMAGLAEAGCSARANHICLQRAHRTIRPARPSLAGSMAKKVVQWGQTMFMSESPR
jgi:hypothetical protein